MIGGLGSSISAATRNPAIRRQQWWVVNVRNQRVGRIAPQIATLLMGKHKPIYTPGTDCGDYVIVLNAAEVAFSGKKWQHKFYKWHTGYPGGLKMIKAANLLKEKPEEIIKKAVKGMMPESKLSREQFGRLKIFIGATHNHSAQEPREYRIFDTRKADRQGAPWNLLPQYKIDFIEYQDEEGQTRWKMQTTHDILNKEDKAKLKQNKRKGLLGLGHGYPHPEGYIRGGRGDRRKGY
jgi:large subunit ribosomal protein L13